jgi:hypothetical protein
LAIQKRITDANVPFEAGDGLVYVTAAEHRYNTCTARRERLVAGFGCSRPARQFACGA